MNAMNDGLILVPDAQHPKRRPWIVMLICGLIAACAPELNWREVRQDEGGWKALFPGKPVEVSRSIPMPNANGRVTLTLHSARIRETMYAIGVVEQGSAAIREGLENAMLANIQSQPRDVERRTVSLQGLTAVEVSAKGRMLIDPMKPAVPARLLMRSLVLPTVAGRPGRVVEAIAVGPESELTEDQARQFVDSLGLLGR